MKGAAPPAARTKWQLAGLVALALIAYLPLWRAGFIWDDDSMLTSNPLIRAGDGLYQFWFTRNALDYWPVTSTTLWVEWRLWGMHPLGYHLVNLLLHLVEVLLLWAALRRLRIPGAWLAALLFAVHPLNVESVSWIAERKNVLAMLFYLLAILWFLKAEPEPPPADGAVSGAPARVPEYSYRWYGLSLLAFVLGMLSKGSIALLPVVLFGFIWSRRRPTAGDLGRLAPFFAVAGILAAVNVWFQQHGLAASEVIRSAGWGERLLGAGAVIWFYLYKSLWPARLIFVYPQWHIQTANAAWWLPLLAALGFTALLAVLALPLRGRASPTPTVPKRGESWARPALFAWGYFCVSLVPVLGLTDVYFMKFSLVADHYTHLALIGVVAWLGFAADSVYRRAGDTGRFALGGFLAAAVVALAGLTWKQNLMYRDDLVLYRTILDRNPGAWMAHNNLGQILDQQLDRTPEAMAEFEAALRLKPDYAEAHNNLGLELAKIPGRQADAMAQYAEALRIKPNYAPAHDNLGNELMKIPGRLPEALAHYQQAVAINPDFAGAQNNFALALAKIPGRLPEAVDHYEQALRIDPDLAQVHHNLAAALAQLPGRSSEALDQYREAVRLDPNSAEAHIDLALELATVPGQLPEAVAHYEQALRINPNDADAENDLAVALAKIPGRLPDALAHFERSLRINPDDADTNYNYANQLMAVPGRLADAVTHYERALRSNPDFASAHYNLAVAEARAGRLEEAIRHFARVLEIDPANQAARANLDHLRSIQR